MSAKLKFRCPECQVRLSAKFKVAGRQLQCPNCDSELTVPTSTALVPADPRIVAPVIVDDYKPPPRIAVPRRMRNAYSTPVELRLPGQLGGIRAEVDRKTSNMMATTFLGAVLVSIGAVLFAMFGGKSKST